MITRLSGILEAVEGLNAIIAPKGEAVAYEVLLPAFLAERLAAQRGRAITLHTIQYLESQGQGTSFVPRLVGFEQPQDRAFFTLFITVKGIGNRKALRAMALPPAAIAAAIRSKDAKSLTKLPEVGKRLAETIIAELHGKVDSYLTEGEVASLDQAAAAIGITFDPVSEEAVLALMALGETRGDAEAMVSRAIDRGRKEGRPLATTEEVLERVFAGRA